MSIGSRVIVDFVFKLTWAEVWAGQYLIIIKIGVENNPKIISASVKNLNPTLENLWGALDWAFYQVWIW